MSDIVWKKSEILKQLSGDEVFLKELINDLAELIKESRRGLETALAQGDFPQAASISHTLKGSSGNLSAHEIYIISKELEADCKNSGAKAAELNIKLSDALDRFLAEVRAQGFLG